MDAQRQTRPDLFHEGSKSRDETPRNETVSPSDDNGCSQGVCDTEMGHSKKKDIRNLIRRVSYATFTSFNTSRSQDVVSSTSEPTGRRALGPNPHCNKKAGRQTKLQPTPTHYKPPKIPRSKKTSQIRIVSVKTPSGAPRIAQPVSYKSKTISRNRSQYRSQHRSQNPKVKSKISVTNRRVHPGLIYQKRSLADTSESFIHPALRKRKNRVAPPAITREILFKDLPALPSNELPVVPSMDSLDVVIEEWQDTPLDDTNIPNSCKTSKDAIPVKLHDILHQARPWTSEDDISPHDVWLDTGLSDSPIHDESPQIIPSVLPNLAQDDRLQALLPQPHNAKLAKTNLRNLPPLQTNFSSPTSPDPITLCGSPFSPSLHIFDSNHLSPENTNSSPPSPSCYSQDSDHSEFCFEPLRPLPKSKVICPLCNIILNTETIARDFMPILQLRGLRIWEYRELRKLCCLKHFPTHPCEAVINEAEEWLNVTEGKPVQSSEIQELEVSELLRKYERWDESNKRVVDFVRENFF